MLLLRDCDVAVVNTSVLGSEEDEYDLVLSIESPEPDLLIDNDSKCSDTSTCHVLNE